MIKRTRDRWLSAWDEYGASLDTGRIVQVTTGILSPETHPALAISVAGETPVALTYEAARGFRECLQRAIEEHQAIAADSRRFEPTDSSATETATLTHAQWLALALLVHRGTGSHREALAALTGCAPPTWLHDLETRPAR